MLGKKFLILVMILTILMIPGCNNGDYKKADDAPVQSKDNKQQAEAEKNPFEGVEFVKWNEYKFGSFDQDGNEANGKEPITWIAVSVDEENGKVLLLSRDILTFKEFNDIEDTISRFPNETGNMYDPYKVDITWENCTLRKWLNGEFYKEAFSAAEKKQIMKVVLENKPNSEYGTLSGNDTEDKVFLLSVEEAGGYGTGYGLLGYIDSTNDKKIERRATSMDQKKYERQKENRLVWEKYPHDYYYTAEGYLANRWWLRTSGAPYGADKIDSNRYLATYVDETGKIQLLGTGFGANRNSPAKLGVRPALYISIK